MQQAESARPFGMAVAASRDRTHPPPHPCNKFLLKDLLVVYTGEEHKEQKDIRRKKKKILGYYYASNFPTAFGTIASKEIVHEETNNCKGGVFFSVSDKETSCLRENSVRNRCDTDSLSTDIFVRRMERVDTPLAIMSEFYTCNKKKTPPPRAGQGKKKTE